MGAARLGSAIHIMGGGSEYDDPTVYGDHWAYDVDSEAYVPKADTPDEDQWDPCVVAYNGALYAAGGYPSGEKTMRKYDPKSNPPWETMARGLTRHLHGFACALVGDVIYVIAGSSKQSDTPTNRVSAYTISTDTWAAKKSLPDVAIGVAGATIGDKIYVVGRGSFLDIYDPQSNTWSTGPSPGRDLEHAVGAAHNGSLYVFGPRASGGSELQGSNEAYRFDTATQTWSKLPDMSSARSYAAVVVFENRPKISQGKPCIQIGLLFGEPLDVFPEKVCAAVEPINLDIAPIFQLDFDTIRKKVVVISRRPF